LVILHFTQCFFATKNALMMSWGKRNQINNSSGVRTSERKNEEIWRRKRQHFVILYDVQSIIGLIKMRFMHINRVDEFLLIGNYVIWRQTVWDNIPNPIPVKSMQTKFKINKREKRISNWFWVWAQRLSK
jgi:hypothetical protein